MKKRLSILFIIALTQLNTAALGVSYEIHPKFQGNERLSHFMNWVQQRIIYPPSAWQSGIQGRVLIEFCVEQVRVINQSPRRTPGYQSDKPVKVRFTRPFDFTIPAKLSLDTTRVYRVADKMPKFQGGDINKFKQWAEERIAPLRAMGSGINGQIVLSFIVEKDGSLSTIQVLQSFSKAYSEDAVKIVSKSPRWSPGTKNGKAVRVQMLLRLKHRVANRTEQ